LEEVGLRKHKGNQLHQQKLTEGMSQKAFLWEELPPVNFFLLLQLADKVPFRKGALLLYSLRTTTGFSLRFLVAPLSN